MPKTSCNPRTIAASPQGQAANGGITIAVLTVVFTILINAVNTSQDTIKAAIKISKSVGISVALDNFFLLTLA